MVTSTSYGSIQNKTSATTAVFTTNAIIPAGTLLVIGICCDNVAAATPTISSITAVGGGSWANRAGSVSQSGATATAGTGVMVYTQTLFTTSQIASGTSITVTFSVATVAKAVVLWGFAGLTNTLRNTVASAASTTGVPSIATAGAALVTGDVVIGVAGAENSAIMTGDADTLNGSWSAINGITTTGSTANLNCSIGMQWKQVTATGVQTFNPTGGVADSVAVVYAFVPVPNPKIETLIDPFDLTIDKSATKWWSTSTQTIWEAGRAKIPVASTYYTLATNDQGGYDLTGSSVYAQLALPAAGNGSREAFFEIIRAKVTNDKLSMYVTGSPQTLFTRRTVVGVNTAGNSVLYDPIVHAFLRIRESGGTVYFDTSPDASTWTNLWSTAPGFAITDVYLNMPMGYYGTETAADAFVDNVNVIPPPPAATATLIDTFDTQIDATKWGFYNAVTWDAGRVKLDSLQAYSNLYTKALYDFTNSSVFAKLTPPAGATSRELYLGVRDAADANGVYAYIVQGNPPPYTLIFRSKVSSTNTDQYGSWDPVAHAFLRLRNSGTTFYWDGSPDGNTWTNLYSTTLVIATTPMVVVAVCGQWQAEADTQPGYVDNINVAQLATGRPKVWTGSVWAKKPSKVWTGGAFVEKPTKVWTGSQWKLV